MTAARDRLLPGEHGQARRERARPRRTTPSARTVLRATRPRTTDRDKRRRERLEADRMYGRQVVIAAIESGVADTLLVRALDPRLCRRVPCAGGEVFLRLRRGCPGAGRGGDSQEHRHLVTGDRGRRRHPRGCLGCRCHRSGRSERLARRDPAHPAQGTPASGSAVAVHRLRRAADDRVYHRHTPRGGARATRRAGTASSPARPGGGPHPSAQGHRAGQPTLHRSDATPPGWKSSWPQQIWWPGPN